MCGLWTQIAQQRLEGEFPLLGGRLELNELIKFPVSSKTNNMYTWCLLPIVPLHSATNPQYLLQCLCSQCAAIPCINQTSFHDVVDFIITPEALVKHFRTHCVNVSRMNESMCVCHALKQKSFCYSVSMVITSLSS